MAEIRPFKGLLYNNEKIGGDYADVVAPPYDVIPPEMQDELYNKSDYNIIRLILGKSQEGDNDSSNKYMRAKEAFSEWQASEVLKRDSEDSFYVYLQEYEYKGEKCRRVGFIGLMKIGERDNDEVLPHEHTLAKPKEDRLNLIKQVRSNLSPIFSLFDGAGTDIQKILEETISQEKPILDITLDDGRHAFWRLSDKDKVGKIVSGMKEKKAFIADGHHRYEVSRTYRDFRRQEEGYNGSADHVMMYFADMSEERNLTVMATHRVVKVMPTSDIGKIEKSLEEHFNISECSDLSSLEKKLEDSISIPHSFGFFADSKYLCMTPKDKESLTNLIEENKADEWKSLDVSALHSAVFGKILSLENKEGNITYVKVPEDAERLVKDGSHMAAFLLNPTKVAQMKAVAELGEMMPQKSTYFYPKLLTGLVINKLD